METRPTHTPKIQNTPSIQCGRLQLVCHEATLPHLDRWAGNNYLERTLQTSKASYNYPDGTPILTFGASRQYGQINNDTRRTFHQSNDKGLSGTKQDACSTDQMTRICVCRL